MKLLATQNILMMNYIMKNTSQNHWSLMLAMPTEPFGLINSKRKSILKT